MSNTMRRLILIAAILLALLGTLPLFSPDSYFVDLASHFVVQYMFAAGLLALLSVPYLGWRQPAAWRRVLLPALAMAINGFWLLPYLPSAGGGGSLAAGPRLTVIQANLEVFNPARAAFVGWVRENKPDLLVVEELTPPWLDALSGLEKILPHRLVVPRADRFGMGIYSRLPIISGAERRALGSPLPALTARLQWRRGVLRVAAAHPPPPVSPAALAMRNLYLEDLARWARDGAGAPTLLAGDLNSTPFAPAFRRFLGESGLADGRRGQGLLASWPSFAWAPLRLGIDHLLTGPGLKLVRLAVSPPLGSDHLALIAEIEVVPRAGRAN